MIYVPAARGIPPIIPSHALLKLIFYVLLELCGAIRQRFPNAFPRLFSGNSPDRGGNSARDIIS